MGIPGDHARVRRAALAALVPGEPCPRCGGGMYLTQALDLDHLVPRMEGGQGPRALAHASCNRRHGQAIGAAARRARKSNWRRRPMIKRALGIEVYADRGRTALVLAGIPELGSADVELLPLVQGTDAVPAVRALAGRVKLAAIAVDPRSNAATLLEPLRLAGLPVKTPDASDVAVAHGKFSDLTAAGRLRHHRQADLTAAIRFAQSRRLSGSEAIQRYGGTVDPAPAVAAELAVWALGDLDHPDGLQPFALWG